MKKRTENHPPVRGQRSNGQAVRRPAGVRNGGTGSVQLNNNRGARRSPVAILVMALVAVAIIVAGILLIRGALAEREAKKQADFQAKVDARVAADLAAAEAEAAAAAQTSTAEGDAQAAAEDNVDYFEDVIASHCSLYDTENTEKETNLRLACEAIDGTIIRPGEIFSFNEVVGERTEEKGYQEASAYIAGSVVPELGGGICQVASTMYYCVLLADLQVVERSPHRYIVTYVPGGIDATIYWGRYDFRFRNDTDYSILINASTKDGRCWISFSSKNVNHYVTVLESEMVSMKEYETEIIYNEEGISTKGINGYTYKVTRKIYDSNGKLVREDSSQDLGDLGYSAYDTRNAVKYVVKEPDES